MTTEEKAKAYDRALEIAKAWCKIDNNDLSNDDLETLFPELKESKDERIRKEIITLIQSCDKGCYTTISPSRIKEYTAWLEKQGEQKPTQEIEPFEAEHGKYYYCIKDYFCGGRKQASKGDVVQALRGLPIMGLKDAGEYFLPVNSIKCNSAWNEKDEIGLSDALWAIKQARTVVKDENDMGTLWYAEHWLKSLKTRYTWKPSDEQIDALKHYVDTTMDGDIDLLYQDLKELKGE